MSSQDNKPLQSRRRFLSSLLEAGLSIPKTWAQTKTDAIQGVPKESRRKTAVSPPGSLSHEHLNSSCTGCGLCIQKCPTKVLKPSTSEYGIEAVMQPVLDFSRGYCDYECTVCTDVCPNGSITHLDIDTKQSVQIGTAVLVSSMCLNDRTGDSCTVCRDVCPASAIKLKADYNQEMVDVDGIRKHRVYPVIEDILCIGCGLCENKCPSSAAPAIHVEGFKEHVMD